MTRILRVRFRRLVLVAALGAGALGLAIGTAATASAGENPPSPVPTVHYTPPPQHHKHKPKPREECFYSLETEHDVLGQQDQQQGNGGGYTAPTATTDTYASGQPQDKNKHQEAVEVVQVVRVCIEGQGDHQTVTVKDVTQPFAWFDNGGGPSPTPSGLPESIAGMLPAAGL